MNKTLKIDRKTHDLHGKSIPPIQHRKLDIPQTYQIQSPFYFSRINYSRTNFSHARNFQKCLTCHGNLCIRQWMLQIDRKFKGVPSKSQIQYEEFFTLYEVLHFVLTFSILAELQGCHLFLLSLCCFQQCITKDLKL